MYLVFINFAYKNLSSFFLINEVSINLNIIVQRVTNQIQHLNVFFKWR